MQPLAFGYMYAPNDMSAEEVDRRHHEIEVYATQLSFSLAKVFCEWDAELKLSLNELIAELQRTAVRYVLIRRPSDFANSRVLQDAIWERLIETTRATIMIMDEA